MCYLILIFLPLLYVLKVGLATVFFILSSSFSALYFASRSKSWSMVLLLTYSWLSCMAKTWLFLLLNMKLVVDIDGLFSSVMVLLGSENGNLWVCLGSNNFEVATFKYFWHHYSRWTLHSFLYTSLWLLRTNMRLFNISNLPFAPLLLIYIAVICYY